MPRPRDPGESSPIGKEDSPKEQSAEPQHSQLDDYRAWAEDEDERRTLLKQAKRPPRFFDESEAEDVVQDTSIIVYGKAQTNEIRGDLKKLARGVARNLKQKRNEAALLRAVTEVPLTGSLPSLAAINGPDDEVLEAVGFDQRLSDTLAELALPPEWTAPVKEYPIDRFALARLCRLTRERPLSQRAKHTKFRRALMLLFIACRDFDWRPSREVEENGRTSWQGRKLLTWKEANRIVIDELYDGKAENFRKGARKFWADLPAGRRGTSQLWDAVIKGKVR